jgi:hypothetical protein
MRKLIATVFNYSLDGLLADEGTEPGVPRGLFLGDYMGLETIAGDDVISLFTSTVSDGADVHSIRANHP